MSHAVKQQTTTTTTIPGIVYNAQSMVMEYERTRNALVRIQTFQKEASKTFDRTNHVHVFHDEMCGPTKQPNTTNNLFNETLSGSRRGQEFE